MVLFFKDNLCCNDAFYSLQINENLKMESEQFGDIIQGGFIDSYRNLTLKTLTLLDWVYQYCSNAYFIIKIDADSFLNIFKLSTFVRQAIELDIQNEHKLYCTGPVIHSTKPFRNVTYKFCPVVFKFQVELDEYPFHHYLPYCRGDAYILTR